MSIGECSYRNVSAVTGAVVFDWSCSNNSTEPSLPTAWQPVATAGTAVGAFAFAWAGFGSLGGVLLALAIALGDLTLRWKSLIALTVFLATQSVMNIWWLAAFMSAYH